METLELDVVVFDGETADDAARAVAGQWAGDVTWSIQDPGGAGGHPAVTYSGPGRALAKIQQRYNQPKTGKPREDLRGKPPVKKGQKRI